MDVQAVLNFFEFDKPFLITTHVHADGDGIGAMLGLFHWLKKTQRSGRMVIDDKTPDKKYRFLPSFDCIELYDSFSNDTSFERAVIVDTPTMSSQRIGNVAQLLSGQTQTLVIDHHAGGANEGTVRFVDESASAASELVYHLIQASRSALTPDMAMCLYAGIAFDTKLFKHSHPDRALNVCHELTKLGADPQQIAEELFTHQTFETVKTLGLALSTLTLQKKGQISMLHIDYKTYSLGGDLDVVVDHALSIDGVEVALFFKEEMPQRQRVSLRSRGKVDVNLVARTFGGGGHQRASGCTIEGALEYAQSKLMAELVKHLG